jgi:hypothetical protein
MFAGWKGAVAGEKEIEATNFLEKKLKSKPALDVDQTIQVLADSNQLLIPSISNPPHTHTHTHTHTHIHIHTHSLSRSVRSSLIERYL